MTSMLKYLQKGNKLKKKCPIWGIIDGCCKKYRCGVALHLFLYFLLTLTLLSIE